MLVQVASSPTQSADPQRSAEVFAGLRPLLFSIAYRMLGSVASSEDVLQEAYLRFDRATRAADAGDGVQIESPRSFLSAVVTRLSIDELKSARVRRESYSGIWLPEPVLTDADSPLLHPPTDPQAHAELSESLSMAFLLVLDRLNPVERAVFLLHDVFAYEFREVAEIVERTEANCRQIASRARKRVRDERPRLDTDPVRRAESARRFFKAMADGDIDGLVSLLAHDVVVYGDGGGKAPQWSTPIVGADRVAKLVAGLGQMIRDYELTLEPRDINGQPGLLVRTGNGEITNVFEIEIRDGRVHAMRGVINPDKLRHLGPVANVRALAEQRKPARRNADS